MSPYQIQTHKTLYRRKKVTLIDALDRVIDKGAYVDGEIVLRVADIDLVFIGLRLLITSISRAEKLSGRRMGALPQHKTENLFQIRKLEHQLRALEDNLSQIIDIGKPKEASNGIAKLALTLIELIKQLMEREALRRIDLGSLTDTEIQKLGLTFKLMEKKIQQLKIIFGIKGELNLDLGPLGNLL